MHRNHTPGMPPFPTHRSGRAPGEIGDQDRQRSTHRGHKADRLDRSVRPVREVHRRATGRCFHVEGVHQSTDKSTGRVHHGLKPLWIGDTPRRRPRQAGPFSPRHLASQAESLRWPGRTPPRSTGMRHNERVLEPRRSAFRELVGWVAGQWSGWGTATTVSPSMSVKSRGLQVWRGKSLEMAMAAIMAP